jgi:long-chain acyl-CoA synthetase
MLHGANRPYNVALVAIDGDRIRAWARETGAALGSDLARDLQVLALVRSDLARRGGELREFEKPRDYLLTEDTFTVDNGMLTPTLKLKRREVYAKFGAALEALYDRPPAPLPPRPVLQPSPAGVP